MNLDLTEREARLVRAQLVRHIAELEDELSHAERNVLKGALTLEIGALRGVHDRLTALLEPSVRPHPQGAGSVR
ncbi:MAG: hypothetical protein M3O36_21295 [Myxococcota bacterium]|nr:hypothetical protein [Myxococcota bacterium]